MKCDSKIGNGKLRLEFGITKGEADVFFRRSLWRPSLLCHRHIELSICRRFWTGVCRYRIDNIRQGNVGSFAGSPTFIENGKEGVGSILSCVSAGELKRSRSIENLRKSSLKFTSVLNRMWTWSIWVWKEWLGGKPCCDGGKRLFARRRLRDLPKMVSREILVSYGRILNATFAYIASWDFFEELQIRLVWCVWFCFLVLFGMFYRRNE